MISFFNLIFIVIHLMMQSNVKSFQIDAMKMGVKEMKREYKKVNIDDIEVSKMLYMHIHVIDISFISFYVTTSY